MTQGPMPPRPSMARIAGAGTLALIAALAVTLILRAILVPLLDVSPAFRPATPPSVILFTVLGTLGAVIAFALVARYSRSPARTYWIVATTALLLSFIPDFLLFSPRAPFEDVTPRGVAILMVLHVGAFLAIVPILVRALPKTEATAGSEAVSENP